MKALRIPFVVVSIVAFAALAAGARADETTTTIKFSDPSKPGTVKISVARGDIRIHGADTKDVSVKSEAPTQPKPVRKDGLRVLTESATFSLNEKDNVVTLDALSEGWLGSASDFEITVPRNANVVVSNSYGGDITCSGVAGDLEIKSLNGEVSLDDVVGGVLVETTNGEVAATIRELHPNKPLSFTSTNGAVVLHVPATAKANVHLRTQNGSILTDFDEKTLVTKVEALPGGGGHVFHGHEILPPEAREAIREATRAGFEAAREAAEAVREAAEESRRAAHSGSANDHADAEPMPPPPPVPPLPAIPTLTGGKLVTGTLNGGGPEINVATMNGDVTLRRIEAK